MILGAKWRPAASAFSNSLRQVSTIAVLFTDLRERQNRSVELQYGANSAARCYE
jgi:hypothetical protein